MTSQLSQTFIPLWPPDLLKDGQLSITFSNLQFCVKDSSPPILLDRKQSSDRLKRNKGATVANSPLF